MPGSALTTRTLTAADFNAFHKVVDAAFLHDPDEQTLAADRALFEPERFHGIFDGTELIGGGGIFTKDLTLPGTGPHPVAAVTAVGVAPGHRRRGALTTLMRAQLHGLHEAGDEPFAALWASEGSIYGRFGYGAAAQRAHVDVPKGAPFLSTVDCGTERVRELDRSAALPLLYEVYQRVAEQRVGWLNRTEAVWNRWLLDTGDHRRGFGPLRFAVHPDGYAIYRVKHEWGARGPECKLDVHELATATPVATAALWRHLLDSDLVAEVSHAMAAVDDPLVHLLANPRVAVRRLVDSLWVRIVDVDRALPARQYSAPLDTVLEISDAFCPWNSGCWRLKVDESGSAQVERSSAQPQLSLDVAALGAVFLGGTRLSALAGAGRVREHAPGALAATSLAFSWVSEPGCPEIF